MATRYEEWQWRIQKMCVTETEVSTASDDWFSRTRHHFDVPTYLVVVNQFPSTHGNNVVQLVWRWSLSNIYWWKSCELLHVSELQHWRNWCDRVLAIFKVWKNTFLHYTNLTCNKLYNMNTLAIHDEYIQHILDCDRNLINNLVSNKYIFWVCNSFGMSACVPFISLSAQRFGILATFIILKYYVCS
jgi:hypothetical protein